MTENWEDITGSMDKPEEGSLVRDSRGAVNWKHESEEVTAGRRARALEAIFVAFGPQTIQASGQVTAERLGKKFDFFPASDTFFIYSTQKYGHDIEKLCSQFLRWALSEEKKALPSE